MRYMIEEEIAEFIKFLKIEVPNIKVERVDRDLHQKYLVILFLIQD